MNLKKSSLILLCVLFISASMFTIHSDSVMADTTTNVTFADISKNHEAYEEINYLVSLGVIQGYFVNGKRVFGPNESVTREQVAKMVVVASGNKPLVVNKSSFSDVTVGTEMSGYIERAVQLGFFSTNTQGKFLPKKAITRDEMSHVLTKAFNLDTSEYENLDSPFADVSITHPYVKYVNTIYYNGITNGSGKNYLPNSTVTRAHFSLFVARAKSEKYRLELPVKGSSVPDTKEVIGLVKVTTDGLNIRKTADSSSNTNIVGIVNKGGKLSVYEVQGKWLKVTYKGAYAYLYKDYAQFLDADGNELGAVQKEVTSNGAINLYVKPTSSAKVIQTIKANVKLPVYKTAGGYHLTQVNGLPGYIVANSTTETGKDEQTNPTPPTTPPTASGDVLGRATVGNLNVRSEANATSTVLFKLNKGDSVKVNGINGYWASIEYNGKSGYVHKSYLKLLNQNGKPLQNRIIILDPGHGGKDPGTVLGSFSEKNITLKVSTLVKQKLENAGAKVYMTRTADTFPTLQGRVDFTNANYGEIFVSVHVNSASNTSASGTETYYSISSGDMYQEDIDLGTFVNNQIVNNLNMKNRGVKQYPYYVINNMSIPSILVELGFLTNDGDRQKMTTDENVNKFADSIYNGIEQYYKKQ
ncbi:N-acetylmuramoyl-L-alanine amidase [Lysinibacillus sp. M3]|uniref:N-acetylmuramoyl-L-alanine amidase n=1 Tax=Lysinibacillus zambalensis TaxID=3160866 RepID=A0ABV1MWI4_9BACI